MTENGTKPGPPQPAPVPTGYGFMKAGPEAYTLTIFTPTGVHITFWTNESLKGLIGSIREVMSSLVGVPSHAYEESEPTIAERIAKVEQLREEAWKVTEEVFET